ncbi:unnamed protein product [Adineta ricciae]|uniref:Uncharacterized protein n=1 Tax=Adineta ricciae TaxID=249248 RepID=A0A815YVZ2_ADIRI|nr:unnamed protein product [Adineta ricciae]CAF1576950.1 unnamed protein product [Adineta ricciae]
MAFENRRVIFITSSVLAVTAILYIIANGLPMWFQLSDASGSFIFGLWQDCLKTGAKLVCKSLPTARAKDKVLAARAFMTVSCILSSSSAVSVLLIAFVNENLKKNISVLAKGLVVASVIGGIIGVSLGISITVDALNAGASVGASFILAIIALVFNIAVYAVHAGEYLSTFKINAKADRTASVKNYGSTYGPDKRRHVEDLKRAGLL